MGRGRDSADNGTYRPANGRSRRNIAAMVVAIAGYRSPHCSSSNVAGCGVRCRVGTGVREKKGAPAIRSPFSWTS